jgi:hypothetical protein
LKALLYYLLSLLIKEGTHELLNGCGRKIGVMRTPIVMFVRV